MKNLITLYVDEPPEPMISSMGERYWPELAADPVWVSWNNGMDGHWEILITEETYDSWDKPKKRWKDLNKDYKKVDGSPFHRFGDGLHDKTKVEKIESLENPEGI